ncbi:MAG: helix-turn-helix transcriptional regulator [Bdellovibrionales bacterium]|nr:helix-turn-helix transcriptional regulator [Bdellovibrionales bacterium]
MSTGVVTKECMGERIERLIKAHNMRIRDLARELGVPNSTIFGWIGKGGKMPSNPELLLGLARHLGTSIEYLISGEDPKTGDPFRGFRKIEILIRESSEVNRG